MMENFNARVIDKFCGLLHFLNISKKEFEMVADEIQDCNLRTALQGLSLESNQCVDELTTQLKTLGIPFKAPDTFELCLEDSYIPQAEYIPGTGNELMHICSNSENTITKAYSEILEEYLPIKSLRDMMMYQLNALKCAFLKIKTLNSARFASLH